MPIDDDEWEMPSPLCCFVFQRKIDIIMLWYHMVVDDGVSGGLCEKNCSNVSLTRNEVCGVSHRGGERNNLHSRYSMLIQRAIVVAPVLLLVGLAGIGADKDATPPESEDVVIVSPTFLQACTEGDVEKVDAFLQEHPAWNNGRSDQGETCLHVAGIFGRPDVTRRLLQAGADPNARSTFEFGLRMTPLSWNVYAGHVETARVLLEVGKANVNLDFDAMGPPDGPKHYVTCYDIVLEILKTYEKESQGDARQESFLEMKALLESYGAKTYESIQKDVEGGEPEL
eukprot:scaffold1424_cov168-Amphora_coffeaeformis.AAC.4